MQIELADNPSVQDQATAAGFANVEQYIQALLDRDRERLAIQEGIDAVDEGRVQDLDEFDREFREKNGIAQDA